MAVSTNVNDGTIEPDSSEACVENRLCGPDIFVVKEFVRCVIFIEYFAVVLPWLKGVRRWVRFVRYGSGFLEVEKGRAIGCPSLDFDLAQVGPRYTNLATDASLEYM